MKDNIIDICIDAKMLRNALDRILKEDPEATIYMEISNKDAKDIIEAEVEKRGFSITAKIEELKFSPEDIKSSKNYNLDTKNQHVGILENEKFIYIDTVDILEAI